MAMSDKDLKAIYAYIKSLGAKGVAAPAALSPGVAPDRPHIAFTPVMPATQELRTTTCLSGDAENPALVKTRREERNFR